MQQMGEGIMISNQVIQNSLDELKKALEDYKVQWKKEHPYYEYYFE